MNGKGTPRGAVEAAGLLTQSRPNDVCAAESMRSALSVSLDGKLYLDIVERNSNIDQLKGKRRVRASPSKPSNHKFIIEKDEAIMYGFRGTNPKVRWLSAFEFKMRVSLER